MSIPIIDIFAGPGGLGEGFSTYLHPETKKQVFSIALSIEKEYYAHQTLTIRSFYRQFEPGGAPSEYYDFIKNKITHEELFEKWPDEAKKAKKEAWLAELGENKNSTPNDIVDNRIEEALNGRKDWLLIGGPPCQAYSIVGRSRRKEKILDAAKDERVGLYKQYLRILAIHNPAVFVMENVKGILSAQTKENPVFSNILNDLNDPVKAYLSEYKSNGKNLICPGYKVYSLAVPAKDTDLLSNPIYKHHDFIIHSEKHGIPQTRHRVILLGIRKDYSKVTPEVLDFQDEIPVERVLYGLPKLRSGLSKIKDEGKIWVSILKKMSYHKYLADIDPYIKEEILKQIKKLKIPKEETGKNFISSNNIKIKHRPDWFLDDKMGGVCNHHSRGHMESDLLRYLFVSSFGKVKKRSPQLSDFPEALLPKHKNIQDGIKKKKFADRFRVQLADRPSKTVTSHISKDGHYYIHPDPLQCRTFTVREAARIQTFPDNYFFYGPRTAQYIQVGNAVPPLLANKIARVVANVYKQIVTPKKKFIDTRYE